jgi:hypothetical protein
MDKEKVIREIKEGDSEEQKELLKQLQEENLRLRIENAFLKESRRLRLEEEDLLNELRESSTASEENSNSRTFSQQQDFQKPRICTGRSDLIARIRMLSFFRS